MADVSILHDTVRLALDANGLSGYEVLPCEPELADTAEFCRHYGIRVSETHRFLDPHFAPDGKLILNLNETVIVSRRRRK